MVRKLGIPPENLDPLRYAGPKLHLTPVVEAVRRPEVYDRNYPLFTFWRVGAPPTSPASEGEIWYLARFADSGEVGFSPGDAVWLMLGAGTAGAVTNLRTDDGLLVTPLAGIIDVDGIIVANATNAKPLFTEGATANTARLELQVGSAITGAPADTNDAGIVSFDDTQFTVDANGFVQLSGGGQAMDELGVDFNTAPGTNPVDPDANGLITISGNTVANATNLNSPVATHSRALNAFDIDVQLATSNSIAGSSTNDAGLASYVDEHFDLDVNAQVYIADRLRAAPIGTTYNIGVTYANPTFTVHGYDGTALSSTNPGWVVLGDADNEGQRVIIQVTANQSFEDSNGTGDMDNNLFGTTTGVAWAPTLGLPMYIYAVANDNQDFVAFALSRVPHRTGSPAVGNIAVAGSAVASTQGSFFLIESGLTVADFDLNPAVAIGSLRMNKDANDDWFVETSSGAAIGFFQENVFFEMPQGQNGAAASNWWSLANGADTIPTWPVAQTGVNYRIQKEGYQYFAFSSEGPNGSGVGTAGAIRLHLPLNWAYDVSYHCPPSNMSWVSAGTYTTLLSRESTNASELSYLEWVKTGAGTTLLRPGDLTTSQDNIGIWAYVTIAIT